MTSLPHDHDLYASHNFHLTISSPPHFHEHPVSPSLPLFLVIIISPSYDPHLITTSSHHYDILTYHFTLPDLTITSTPYHYYFCTTRRTSVPYYNVIPSSPKRSFRLNSKISSYEINYTDIKYFHMFRRIGNLLDFSNIIQETAAEMITLETSMTYPSHFTLEPFNKSPGELQIAPSHLIC